MGEVLGDNAGARLVFLVEVIMGSGLCGAFAGLVGGEFFEGGCRGDLNQVVVKLGVIEEKGSLNLVSYVVESEEI